MKKTSLLLVLASAALLVACGNGSKSSSTPSTEESSTSSSKEEKEQITVSSLRNLSPSLVEFKDVQEGSKFEKGGIATVTIQAGEILKNGFQREADQASHVYLYVNGEPYKSFLPEGVDMVNELAFTFPVGEEDVSLVLCYATQQHVLPEDQFGYTISMEENENVTMLGTGVSGEKYDYIDGYLLLKKGYVVTKLEYQKDGGEWEEIQTYGFGTTYNTVGMDLVQFSIRFFGEELTADSALKLRVTGEMHEVYSITYEGDLENNLILESSTLVTESFAGTYQELVLATKAGVYIAGISTNVEGTEVSHSHGDWYSFTMPEQDLVITIDFEEEFEIEFLGHDDVVEYAFLDGSDPVISASVTTVAPGEGFYFAAKLANNKVLESLSLNAETSIDTHGEYYGGWWTLPVYVPAEATEAKISIETAAGYTLNSEDENVGISSSLLGAGWSASFAVYPGSGKAVDEVKLYDDNNTEITDVELTAAGSSYSFLMPETNVHVVVTYRDLDPSESYTATAYFDADSFSVTTYDYDSLENGTPFDLTTGESFGVTISNDFYENFYFSVAVSGEVVIDCQFVNAEEGDEGTWSTSSVSGSVVIRVGMTEEEAKIEEEAKASYTVVATFDDNYYEVSSSTNFDWDFLEGFEVEEGTAINFDVIDIAYSGYPFTVTVTIGEDEPVVYNPTLDEEEGTYKFNTTITVTGNVTIVVADAE